MKKLTFILLFLFLLVPLVVSQPPTTVIFSGGDTGLRLEAPVLPYFTINEPGELQFHLFNKTNGQIITNSTYEIECLAHLLDLNGTQIFETYATAHTGHWHIEFNSSHVTREGIYSYTIHCNTSDNDGLGGFLIGYFDATVDGLEREDTTPIMIVITLFGLLFIILGSMMLLRRAK